MKIKRLILTLATVVMISGCDVVKQIGSSALNVLQCEYNYNSISNLTISGVDLSKGLSLSAVPVITSILTGNASSIPLNFNLNIDVNNPNTTAAILSGMQYILSIDGVQFTTGSINQPLNVAGGGKSVLPISIGVDLMTLMKGEAGDAIVNIVKNFIGINDTKSNISFKIKPTISVGGYPVSSPVYIPIDFSFGGK